MKLLTKIQGQWLAKRKSIRARAGEELSADDRRLAVSIGRARRRTGAAVGPRVDCPVGSCRSNQLTATRWHRALDHDPHHRPPATA